VRAAAAARDGARAGFSLIELVVVIILIAILYAVAADRLIAMRAQAERSHVENTVGALRSALGVRTAAAIARGAVGELAALAGSNPMDLMTEVPESYRGAFFGPDPAAFDGGQWYFDRRDGALVYRVRYADFFRGSATGPARVRFAIELDFSDRNRNGRFDAAADEIHGLRLRELEPYAWTNRAASG
jgi:prepilin-type N-terminal cleavage/methylation domain-containing protein